MFLFCRAVVRVPCRHSFVVKRKARKASATMAERQRKKILFSEVFFSEELTAFVNIVFSLLKSAVYSQTRLREVEVPKSEKNLLSSSGVHKDDCGCLFKSGSLYYYFSSLSLLELFAPLLFGMKGKFGRDERRDAMEAIKFNSFSALLLAETSTARSLLVLCA